MFTSLRSAVCGLVYAILTGCRNDQIPYKECLKLGISGLYAALVLVIELTETHGHLAAAARTRSCHDYQGLSVSI